MTVLLKFCSNLALLTAFGLTLKKGSGELDPECKQTNKQTYIIMAGICRPQRSRAQPNIRSVPLSLASPGWGCFTKNVEASFATRPTAKITVLSRTDRQLVVLTLSRHVLFFQGPLSGCSQLNLDSDLWRR